MNKDANDRDDIWKMPSPSKNKNLTLLVYLLQALGFVTGGLTAIAALVINYLKMDDVSESWLEGHFRWQVNTFWYGLVVDYFSVAIVAYIARLAQRGSGHCLVNISHC